MSPDLTATQNIKLSLLILLEYTFPINDKEFRIFHLTLVYAEDNFNLLATTLVYYFLT